MDVELGAGGVCGQKEIVVFACYVEEILQGLGGEGFGGYQCADWLFGFAEVAGLEEGFCEHLVGLAMGQNY